ncbi:hypothetical protein SAMN04488550_0050 [Gordonia malaquae]|uniref:Lipoprotein n=2 Tax=Gordonia malaquae TaxID=410332 RepID=M3VHJ3_GORML|nr:hypothetical protein GM1_067_00010 [Gordonia malaquae NBRC 108250]SEB29923.1 hypothetical protein SAMN04488550_0050 [Gordonia malaquae]
MKVAVLSVVFAVALAGCASATPGPVDVDPLTSVTSESVAPPRAESEIYAAVVRQLVLIDHSFGSGPPTPFRQVYVLDSYASGSGDMVIVTDGPPLDADLKNAIANQPGDMPPVEFIARREDKGHVERQGLTAVDNDGVIVGLAPLAYQGEGTVHVGAGYWCGGDCGLAVTYVVDKVHGHWQVTGQTGPMSIA